MTRAELDWDAALTRYAACVDLGGTKDERAFRWGQANAALNTLMLEELQAMRKKARQTTEELKAAA
jgi:hypothetical protein